jgi:hypothetical protein
MSTTIAVYYASELVNWKQLISVYKQEVFEFGHKLGEIIQRNNIPEIGAKVDAEQDKLNHVLRKFFRIREDILQQEAVLKSNSTPIDDSLISTETEKMQNEIRRRMQQTEKEYIEKKHECNNFISGTLKR